MANSQAGIRLINYYAVLNLPPTADLAGIENAYARLSDELAVRMEVDETSNEALRCLNEAYGVLSRPDLRREYDRVFFTKEYEAADRLAQSEVRRRRMLQNVLIGTLLVITAAEGLGLALLAQGRLGF